MNDYTGGAYHNYKGKPFTGFALDGYYENGQVAGEREYVNGEDIGWIIMIMEILKMKVWITVLPMFFCQI